MCLKSRHPTHHVKASIYLTRPRALADINAIGGDPHSQVVKITRKNMHHYVNGRPSDLPLVYKQLFYDLYTTYKVKSETVLPFALLHLECTDYNNYEVRLFSHDMRTISFQDDASIISQLTLELNQSAVPLFFRVIKVLTMLLQRILTFWDFSTFCFQKEWHSR